MDQSFPWTVSELRDEQMTSCTIERTFAAPGWKLAQPIALQPPASIRWLGRSVANCKASLDAKHIGWLG